MNFSHSFLSFYTIAYRSPSKKVIVGSFVLLLHIFKICPPQSCSFASLHSPHPNPFFFFYIIFCFSPSTSPQPSLLLLPHKILRITVTSSKSSSFASSPSSYHNLDHISLTISLTVSLVISLVISLIISKFVSLSCKHRHH